jgi:hypothetical protein
VAGAGAQSYNSAGAGDEKPEFAQHYLFQNKNFESKDLPGIVILDRSCNKIK